MYNLELEKAVAAVKKEKAKRVLVQLPDGLKLKAREVVETIEKETGAEVFLWLSSCYGACDIPLGLNTIKIDLLIQFGHSIFHKTEEW